MADVRNGGQAVADAVQHCTSALVIITVNIVRHHSFVALFPRK